MGTLLKSGLEAEAHDLLLQLGCGRRRPDRLDRVGRGSREATGATRSPTSTRTSPSPARALRPPRFPRSSSTSARSPPRFPARRVARSIGRVEGERLPRSRSPAIACRRTQRSRPPAARRRWAIWAPVRTSHRFCSTGVPSTDIGSRRAIWRLSLRLRQLCVVRDVADPTFVYEQQQARVFGLEVLHIADADVLPYDYVDLCQGDCLISEGRRARAKNDGIACS